MAIVQRLLKENLLRASCLLMVRQVSIKKAGPGAGNWFVQSAYEPYMADAIPVWDSVLFIFNDFKFAQFDSARIVAILQ